MRFQCGLARALRHNKRVAEFGEAKLLWRPWFAWYPVKIGEFDCRWLESVERRLQDHATFWGPRIWEYRPKEEGGAG